jgi:hypothetical protein
MARYELSLSPTYVKHWTYIEAVREIFQNAIDQETTNPENIMAYSHRDDTLKIYSMKSSLDKSSLLMGNTSKAGDENQIGSFGEGYKLAMLVLARDGFDMSIHNYTNKETWTPKIINSRRYKSELLVVDVTKWQLTKVPNNDLTFVIKGITDKHFAEIKENMLFLRDVTDIVETDRGNILMDPEYQGKIFVNGLFVQKLKGNILYGYDMKAKAIVLDRDRRAVNEFQLTWDTSYMWSKVAKTMPELFVNLLDAGALDIQYINSSGHCTSKDPADIAYEDFVSRFGVKAIPISCEYDKTVANNTYTGIKTVVVPTITKDLIKQSSGYLNSLSSLDNITAATPSKVLIKFYNDHRDCFTTDAIHDFEVILDDSEGWVS